MFANLNLEIPLKFVLLGLCLNSVIELFLFMFGSCVTIFYVCLNYGSRAIFCPGIRNYFSTLFCFIRRRCELRMARFLSRL